MRLIVISICILIFLCFFILILPVNFLQTTEPVLNSEIREDVGLKLVQLAEFTSRYNTANDLLEYILVIHPEKGEYYWQMSQNNIRLENLNEAINDLNKALERDPSNIKYLLTQARLYLGIGKINKSDEIYNKIKEINPISYENNIYSGDAALDKGEYIVAYYRYGNAINLDPKNGKTYEKLGDVIFALLTIPTAGINANQDLLNKDIYIEGIKNYQVALLLLSGSNKEIQIKIDKYSSEYIPRTINELRSRYTEYYYINSV